MSNSKEHVSPPEPAKLPDPDDRQRDEAHAAVLAQHRKQEEEDRAAFLAKRDAWAQAEATVESGRILTEKQVVPANVPPQRHKFRLAEGHEFSHVNGRLHSENNAPAVVYADGTRWWYDEGRIHRVGAPAVILSNGTQEFWQNNQRHRVEGPAVIYPDTPKITPALRGVKQWWTTGILVRENVPPRVKRYRDLIRKAQISCFGGPA